MFHLKEKKREDATPGPEAFRDFAEALESAVVLVTPERRIVYMNRVAEQLWGSKEGSLCYRTLHDSRRVCADCLLGGVIETNEVRSKELRMRAADGWHTYENLLVPLKGPDPHTHFVAIVYTNIDYQKRLEEEAARADELSKAILSAPTTFVIGYEADGQVEFVNRAWEEVSGYPAREMAEGGGFRALVPVEYRREVDDYMSLISRGVEPSTRLVVPFATREGEEKIFSWTYSLISSQGAAGKKGVMIGQDVTERVRATARVERWARELEVVNRILKKAGASVAVEEMLDTMLDELLELLGYRCGAAYLLGEKGESAKRLAMRGFAKSEPPRRMELGERIFPATAVYERRIEFAGPGNEMHPTVQEAIDSEGLKGFVAVPLLPGGEPVGMMLLGHDFGAERAEGDRAIIEAAVEAFELGVENLFLRARAEERASEATALYRVARRVSEGMTLGRALDRVVEEAAALFRADICSIFLYEDETGLLRGKAGVGADVEAMVAPLEKSIIGSQDTWTLKPVASEDAQQDLRILRFVVESHGVKSSLTAPLVVDGRFAGVLFLGTKSKRRYSERELELIENFAGQAAIAIQNASLIEGIKKSEEKYRLLVESAEDIVFTADKEARLTFMNEGVLPILGFRPEELLGSQYLDYVEGADRAFLESVIDKVTSGEVIQAARLPLRARDGAEVFLDLKINPIVVGDTVTGAVGVARDVTEQVRAEQSLRESEERYRIFVETSPNAVLTADFHGEILFANTSSVNMTGVPREELIGRNIDDFLAPEEVESVDEDFKAALESGRSIVKRLTRTVLDGTERYFEASAVVMDEPGPDARVMIIANDVTERERALRGLRESEERYRVIVESSKDTITMINRAGEILYASPEVERAFGVKPEQVIGRHIFRFLHPDDRETVAQQIARDYRTGSTIGGFPVRSVREDGTLVHAEVSAGLIGWPGDDALMILVIRDVTERKRREEEQELRLRVEETVADILTEFVDPREIHEAISYTLEKTGKLLGVGRAHYFEFSRDGETLSCEGEWVGEECEPVKDELQGLRTADYPLWIETLSAGRTVILSDTREVPEEAVREILKGENVLAVAVAPVFKSERLAGFLSYHDVEKHREWALPEVETLREVADIISHALDRREWIEELERSERFQAGVTDSTGDGLLVLRENVVTWVNRRACEILGYGPEEMLGLTTERFFPDSKQLEGFALDAATIPLRGKQYSWEGRAMRKDGTFVDVRVSLNPMSTAEVDYPEIVATVADITESKRMQEKVEFAADAYSTIFSMAVDGLIVHTVHGEIRDVNERVCTDTGFSHEELLAMRVTDLFPAKVRHLFDERRDEVLRDGFTFFETKLARKDGEALPVEINARTAKVWDEEVVLSAVHDISERKTAEAETRRRSVQLASLNEILKAATRSLELDLASKYVLAASMEESGAKSGVLILERPGGTGVFDLMASEGFTPEQLSKLDTDALKTELAELASGPWGAAVLDIPSMSADEKRGEIFDLFKEEGFSCALLVPVKKEERVTGVLCLASKRRNLFREEYRDFYNAAGAEVSVALQNAIIYRELAAEHERLALLYRSAQDISEQTGIDALLDTLAREAAEAIGADSALIAFVEPGRDEFVWRGAYNLDLGLLEGIHMPLDKGLGGEVVGSKRAVLTEVGEEPPEEVIRKDLLAGIFRGKKGIGVPLVSGDRILGVLTLQCPKELRVSDEDVFMLEAMGRHAGVGIENAMLYEETRLHLQALEVAHEELMELDRLKSDFVSTVSHELRSPLAVIEGFARTLVEHFDRVDPDTEKESLEIILKKSTILEGLIANILDMSRIEAGKLEVRFEVLDLRELCRRVIGDQERMVEVHEIELVAPDKEVKVVADPERVEVVLGNLMRNATKFSPEGGTVTISLREFGEMAEVSVTDEGIGVRREEQEKIFDRFYQVDSGENRAFPGTGLGLYITSELLRAMGGTIRVDSEPGKGSTFTFTLPLAGIEGVAEGQK